MALEMVESGPHGIFCEPIRSKDEFLSQQVSVVCTATPASFLPDDIGVMGAAGCARARHSGQGGGHCGNRRCGAVASLPALLGTNVWVWPGDSIAARKLPARFAANQANHGLRIYSLPRHFSR